MIRAPLFPIPAPEGTPPWINVIFGIAAITVFVVIVWQAVRYFRDHRDD
ncbi:MAG: hypothetical protein WED09_01320 [Homoserinimonas sp.]